MYEYVALLGAGVGVATGIGVGVGVGTGVEAGVGVDTGVEEGMGVELGVVEGAGVEDGAPAHLYLSIWLLILFNMSLSSLRYWEQSVPFGHAAPSFKIWSSCAVVEGSKQ